MSFLNALCFKGSKWLTDLRDSGSIEQDADKVLMIDKRGGNLALWVRKNLQGIGGEEVIPLYADEYYCNFSELSFTSESLQSDAISPS